MDEEDDGQWTMDQWTNGPMDSSGGVKGDRTSRTWQCQSSVTHSPSHWLCHCPSVAQSNLP
jgi:hypothetical protein